MQPEPRNPFQAASLLERFTRRSCRKGMNVITQGDSRQTVFYVVAGRFGATMYSQSGKKLSLGRMESGDAFGELAAIDSLDRSVTVEALSDAEVLCIERGAFLDIVMSDPAFTRWLLERVTARVRLLTDKLFELSLHSVRQCLLSELHRVAAAANDGTRDGYTALPTHSDLASRIGTNRETVSREIANLVRDREVEIEGRAFRVLHDDHLNEAW